MRLPGLDRLRASALVLMLVQHLTQWLSGDARRVLPGTEQLLVTDLAAPAFAIACGASVALLVDRHPDDGLHRTVVVKYGRLVPIGVALSWVAFGRPWELGVLQCLGIAALAAYAVIAALPPAVAWLATGALLVVSGPVEEVARTWPEHHVGRILLGGTFPLPLYVGFVLVGALAARSLGGRDRPGWAAVAGAVAGSAFVALVASGADAVRYPGGLPFVLAGLAGTALLYAAVSRWWPAPGTGPERLLRRAGARTLWIYVGHYALFVLLDRAGWRGDVAARPAVLLAVVGTAAVVALAGGNPRPPEAPHVGTPLCRCTACAATAAPDEAGTPSRPDRRVGAGPPRRPPGP
jgi:hypothetical protein